MFVRNVSPQVEFALEFLEAVLTLEEDLVVERLDVRDERALDGETSVAAVSFAHKWPLVSMEALVIHNIVLVPKCFGTVLARQVPRSHASPRVLLQRLVVVEQLVTVAAQQLEVVELVGRDEAINTDFRAIGLRDGGGEGVRTCISHANVLKQLDPQKLARLEKALDVIILDNNFTVVHEVNESPITENTIYIILLLALFFCIFPMYTYSTWTGLRSIRIQRQSEVAK